MEENKCGVAKANKRSARDDEKSTAKKMAKTITEEPDGALKRLEPLSPLLDPCDETYDLAAHAKHKNNSGGEVMWVLYLAIRETRSFQQTIDKCQSLLGVEMKQNLQLEGTRHVTLWQGRATPQEAMNICVDNDVDMQLPISIQFDSWIPRGGYLQLDSPSQASLKEWMTKTVQNLPDKKTHKHCKVDCTHLSLYRARGMPWQSFNRECSKVRNGVSAQSFGSVQGVSIRLKVIGSPYDHCRVLVGA